MEYRKAPVAVVVALALVFATGDVTDADLAVAGPGSLTITFTLIADTSTPIPSGTGNFTNFGTNSSIDDSGNVVFCGLGALQEGIHTHTRSTGVNSMVADTDTLIPGGGGAHFTGFGLYGCIVKSSIDDGKVAFLANTVTPGPEIGLYTNADGALEQVAIEDNAVGSFSSTTLRAPWLDGTVVAFTGAEVLPTLQNANRLLRFDSVTDVLTSVSVSDASCGSCTPGFYVNPSLAGTSVAGVRFTTGLTELIIADAAIDIVMNGVTGVPGRTPPETFTSMPNFPVLDANGADIAFVGSSFSGNGVYKRVGGTLIGISKIECGTILKSDRAS